MNEKPNKDNLVSDPHWYLQFFKAHAREFQVVPMEEGHYRESVFTDQRIRTLDDRRFAIPFRNVVDAFAANPPSLEPLDFIFHTGHCGSTLLSRALANAPGVLPIREPMTLNALSGLESRLDEPASWLSRRDWGRLRTTCLRSLARTFRPGQRVLIKVTSTANRLIAPMLDEAGGARALLLYQSLTRHLAASFKKPRSHADVYTQGQLRMSDWVDIPGAPPLRLHELGREQLAVLSWLSCMHRLLDAKARFGDRTMLLDFDRFLQAPEQGLEEIIAFMGYAGFRDELLQGWPGVARQYSKVPDEPFTAGDRMSTHRAALEKYAERVERGREWALQMVRLTPALEGAEQYFESAV